MSENGYYFYLDKCLLPIAPKKLEKKINNANKTVTLINGGQINMLKTPELSDFEFECMIPQVQYPFAKYDSGFKDAAYFLGYFEKLKTDKKPFRFKVTRMLPSGKILFTTNIMVSMEDYKITEQATDGFDLTVKIKLKQFNDYHTSTVDIETGEVHQTRATQSSPEPAENVTYTVAKGDSLWKIAKYFYNDGSKHKLIYDANKDTIGGNPNLIYSGQKLIIPPL